MRSSACLNARTAHSFACFALLASLTCSAAPIRLLNHLLLSSWGSSFCLCDDRVDFIQVNPTVQCAPPPSPPPLPPPVRHRCTLDRNGMKSTRRVRGHSLVRSIVRSHCKLICLLCTSCFTRALRCAHTRARLLTRSRALGKGFLSMK